MLFKPSCCFYKEKKVQLIWQFFSGFSSFLCFIRGPEVNLNLKEWTRELFTVLVGLYCS